MTVPKKCFVALSLWLVIVGVSSSHAALIWDESINGDLSNNELAPTDLPALNPGSNRLVGSIGTWWSSDPGDVFRFTVPSGYRLSEFVLESYDDGTYYDYLPVSLHRGASVSDPYVEFILLTDWGSGTDLLQFDSAPGPQPAGVYTVDISSIEQGTGVDERSLYSIDMKMEAIPAPGAFLLAGLGTGLFSYIRRRRLL